MPTYKTVEHRRVKIRWHGGLTQSFSTGRIAEEHVKFSSGETSSLVVFTVRNVKSEPIPLKFQPLVIRINCGYGHTRVGVSETRCSGTWTTRSLGCWHTRTPSELIRDSPTGFGSIDFDRSL